MWYKTNKMFSWTGKSKEEVIKEESDGKEDSDHSLNNEDKERDTGSWGSQGKSKVIKDVVKIGDTSCAVERVKKVNYTIGFYFHHLLIWDMFSPHGRFRHTSSQIFIQYKSTLLCSGRIISFEAEFKALRERKETGGWHGNWNSVKEDLDTKAAHNKI